jgi:hypothetical protein
VLDWLEPGSPEAWRLNRPHQTVLLDVVLKGIIHRNKMEITRDLARGSFKRAEPGPALGAEG